MRFSISVRLSSFAAAPFLDIMDVKLMLWYDKDFTLMPVKSHVDAIHTNYAAIRTYPSGRVVHANSNFRVIVHQFKDVFQFFYCHFASSFTNFSSPLPNENSDHAHVKLMTAEIISHILIV